MSNSSKHIFARAWVTLIACTATSFAPAQSITGNGMVMHSSGSISGSAWMLSGTGFAGTYITVPAGGATLNFTVNATEGAGATPAPHLNLAIADSTFGFNIASTSASNYATPNTFFPAGTYFLRTERDFTGNTSTTRAFNINSVTINTVGGAGGAAFSNTNTSVNALAAADTYISNFRQGAATVQLTGPGNIPLLPGTSVNVDLKRHAFNFGTAVPGTSTNGVGSYLGSGGTPQQTNYQSRLNQNFNAVVPENIGKWQLNESWTGSNFNNDVVTMGGVDTVLNYAQSHNMRTRMHNMIWGSQQPTMINTYLANGSAGSLTAVRQEITERAGYYAGTGAPSDRATKYTELDVYNESYHTGSTVANSYWNRYTATGIADIYRQVHAAVPNIKLLVNEYNVYADGGDKYANWYQQHLESLRTAGLAAGYGDVMSGIGTQYYANTSIENGNPNSGTASNAAHNPARVMQTIQNLAIEGLPVTVTEFGVKSGASEATAATILSDSLRITFGNASASGFFMWGFQAENGGANLFAPAAALFNVNTSDWNTWTITEAGKVWQDALGIADWDGNPADAWDTLLNAAVNPDSTINFTGFYGDYNIGGQGGFSNLALTKGTSSYSLSLSAPPQWSMWNANNSGSWSTSGNWTTGGIADSVGQTAYFGSAAAPRTITVDGPRTVGMIAFDSAASYTISGTGPLTFDGATGVTAVYVAAGSHTIATPIILNADLNVTVAPAASVLSLSGEVTATGRTITKAGAGVLRMENVRAAALNVTAGGVQVSAKAQPNDPAGSSDLQHLSIAPGAQFDLTNNSALLRDASLEEIRLMLQDSRLFSSAADSTSRLGYGADPAGVRVMFALAGDTDLDGDVDVNDLANLAASWQSLAPWGGGDFSYDGFVDVTDLGILALNWQGQGQAPLAEFGLPSMVPEPGSTLLASVGGAIAVVQRRRVRSRRAVPASNPG